MITTIISQELFNKLVSAFCDFFIHLHKNKEIMIFYSASGVQYISNTFPISLIYKQKHGNNSLLPCQR